ncbi:hypothetical protein SLE2022_123390 [Rubroshorea leprosula]
MASVGVRCGGNHAIRCRPASDLRQLIPRQRQNVRQRQCFFPTSKISSMSRQLNLESSPARKRSNLHSPDRIDEWMKQSVTEIVKKLPESPLLVQVYSDGDEATMMENAEEEKWLLIKEKWEKGEMPVPDGMILVEKIEDGEEEEEEEEISESNAWGIVVQGQGQGRACYLLKTNRVGSGMGVWCTHFCLVRVKSFRETVMSQLKNCWLLQAQ